jgi:hypothetical protein
MSQLENHTITFEPRLSDAEFEEWCRRWPDHDVERMENGQIRMTRKTRMGSA